MFDPKNFSHYLTYGATDQQTVRTLANSFEGLVVPGTVAAFQRDGTGGFVLSLSATKAATPYVIDPRFPLFQQAASDQPKKSHQMLAEIVNSPEILASAEPAPSSFTEERITSIAKGWVTFNTGYTDIANSKFAKYQEKLNEKIDAADRKSPQFILPPYFISELNNEWWEISKSLFERCCAVNDTAIQCVRVIACEKADHLPALLDDVDDSRVAVWVSGLNELTADAEELASYGTAIRKSTKNGKLIFAMYGGFFSVLLSTLGLSGSCHGIGFGEHREWRELPQSGPPPKRYYLKLLHRYVSQEEAQFLWREGKSLVQCDCPECLGKSPVELNYHELMKHSVHCRAEEIKEWSSLSFSEAVEELVKKTNKFYSFIESTSSAEQEKARYLRRSEHLPRWIAALESCC